MPSDSIYSDKFVREVNGNNAIQCSPSIPEIKPLKKSVNIPRGSFAANFHTPYRRCTFDKLKERYHKDMSLNNLAKI